MAVNHECFTDEEINVLTKEILNDLDENPEIDSYDFMNWVNANIDNVHEISIEAPTPPPTCSTRTNDTTSTASPPQLLLHAYTSNDGSGYTSAHSIPESLSLDIRSLKPAINGWSKYMSSSIHSPSSKYIPYIAPPDIYTDDYSVTPLTHISDDISSVQMSVQSTDILSPRDETPAYRHCDIPNFSDIHIKKQSAKHISDDYAHKRKHKRVSTEVIHRHNKSKNRQHFPLKSASFTSAEMNATAHKMYSNKHKKQCIWIKKSGNCNDKTSPLCLESASIPSKLRKCTFNKRRAQRSYKKYTVRTMTMDRNHPIANTG